jgi:hypothetical protein
MLHALSLNEVEHETLSYRLETLAVWPVQRGALRGTVTNTGALASEEN